MAPQPPPALLITRPEPSARRFAAQIQAALPYPVRVVCSPLIQIQPVDVAVTLTAYAGVIVTSQNAVVALADRARPGMRAWCVGDATAAAVARLGLDARTAGGDADALVAAIRASGEMGPFIHLRGEPSRGDVAARLTEAGIRTDAVVVYRQAALALTPPAQGLLDGPGPVVIPVFSPETAANLLAQAPFRASLDLVAISPATAAVLAPLPHRTLHIAQRPDTAAMLEATVAHFTRLPSKG